MMLAETTSVSIGNEKNKSTLIGRSRAGDATSFALPELKWMFDCGALVQGWKPKILFLTHTHSDHAHFLTHIKDETKPPLIYLPAEAEKFVEAQLVAYQEMTDCMTQSESQNGGSYATDYTLRPTIPGETIAFRQGGTSFLVRTLRMDHRVPCLGYSIFKIRDSLKQDYQGLSGKEIGRLRKSGVNITEASEEPFICFMGDTTGAVFSEHPEVLDHKVIVIECSFIDEASIDRAQETTHMHWNDLRPIVAENPRTFFVLTHFSLKYSTLRLRQFFCEQQEEYDNIHPMLVQEEVENQCRKAKKENPEGGLEVPTCKCRVCR